MQDRVGISVLLHKSRPSPTHFLSQLHCASGLRLGQIGTILWDVRVGYDRQPRLAAQAAISLLQYMVRLSLISLLLVSAFLSSSGNLPLSSCLPTALQGQRGVQPPGRPGHAKGASPATPHDSDEVVFSNVHFDDTKRKLKNDVCS